MDKLICCAEGHANAVRQFMCDTGMKVSDRCPVTLRFPEQVRGCRDILFFVISDHPIKVPDEILGTMLIRLTPTGTKFR
jgi:hypothetical protein